jgi:hypothetical protein
MKKRVDFRAKKGVILTGQNGSPSRNRTAGQNSVEKGRNGVGQSVAPTRL